MKIAVVFLFGLAVAVAGRKSYDGYSVYRVTPRTERGIKFISELAENANLGEHLDFWHTSHDLNDPTDVLIPPRFRGLLEDFFRRRKMQFDVMIENVEDLIESQEDCSYDISDDTFYQCYHTLDEIESWMYSFTENSDRATLVPVSSTIEGRTVSAVKITGAEPGRPAVVFQGGIHAREWISPATMMNLAKKFVELYDIDTDITSIVDYYDIYIIPVLNQDGYDYTWTDDRMWRKNKNLNDGAVCEGVDLNRNWDAGWGGDGANGMKCSEVYYGTGPLSEPETTGMDVFTRNLQETSEVHVFIDFHSYGLYWMWPWGYKTDLPNTPDHDDQEEGAQRAASALYDVYGTEYKVHRSALMYAAAGATEDWAYHSAGAKYSYIVELRDEGDFGFLLPDSQIEPTSNETFEAVKALLLYTKEDPNPTAQKVVELP